MSTEESKIPGVRVTRVRLNEDPRGHFAEIQRSSEYGGFAQSNHSRSLKGVVRGLHYHQYQSDLWYVVRGRAQVALADLRNRQDPPTVEVFDLTETAPSVVLIPPGVAHGYAAIEDVDLVYWVTHEYDGSDEYGVAWDDPTLAIPWAVSQPVLSNRDQQNPALQWNSIPRF